MALPVCHFQGLNSIQVEMSDPEETLIDGTHGHGSQSLINLMITGSSSSHVWDDDQDLGGLSTYKFAESVCAS